MKTTPAHSNRSARVPAVIATSVIAAFILSPIAVTARAAHGPEKPASPVAQALTPASDTPTGVNSVTISYRSHAGHTRHAVVLYPASYRHGTMALPVVISPHGRGLDGAMNAKLWGNLPALGNFAVVNPDGEGDRVASLSWGAPGQIDDLARMPQILRAELPWLRIDMHRVYAVGGSMGGQETLLLAGRYPALLAGAVAIDPVVDFAHQYEQYPRLRCLDACRTAYGNLGRALQSLAREEAGGTPQTAPTAYAVRSPLTYASVLAHLRIPVQVWWSTKDRIVVDSDTCQSGRLLREIRRIDPHSPMVGVRGAWIHTAPLRASRKLPAALEGIGLLPSGYGRISAGLHVVAGPLPAGWIGRASRL